MAGSESHEVATDELEQLYDHIVAQFDALKSLVTLFIIMSVESNITKELYVKKISNSISMIINYGIL